MHSPASDTGKKGAICVFCGSSMGRNPVYAEAARQTGALIARDGFNLVFGAGSLGLMGEVSAAARVGGAHVIGILPDFLRHLEPPSRTTEELEIVPGLFERKARMMALSDAFIILPGGLGTMDEFFEVVTSAQLGVSPKPVAVVNTMEIYTPLRTFLDHLDAEGFVPHRASPLYRFVETPEEAMGFIREALVAAKT